MICVCGDPNCAIRHGFCHCGCGGKTSPAPWNNKTRKMVKGVPQMYIVNHHSQPPVDDMYELDPHTQCWNWKHTKNKQGYGLLTRRGQEIRAHRYVYELLRGNVDKNLDLDHLCRNRACVNPDHLEPVTRGENVRRGQQAKLTWKLVDEIKHLDATKTMSRRAIGRKFSVSSSTICAVLNNKMWKDDWRPDDNKNTPL